ncbi:hypothetical protein Aph01nite_70030 [Acrocarpospora phusangensis]|uniref:Uncharacterized protein n=1 Tax=Acrocarpospora phusangensis TaxID=1070424 RepID=A0A919QJA9_9ACTN|nr:hypothetical protein Aph01nite_70030 [Acrocarpospora phusangensis]
MDSPVKSAHRTRLTCTDPRVKLRIRLGSARVDSPVKSAHPTQPTCTDPQVKLRTQPGLSAWTRR